MTAIDIKVILILLRFALFIIQVECRSQYKIFEKYFDLTYHRPRRKDDFILIRNRDDQIRVINLYNN